MNPKNSRKDLDEEDIIKRIRQVKRDQSFPKRWRPIELEYLYELKRYVS